MPKLASTNRTLYQKPLDARVTVSIDAIEHAFQGDFNDVAPNNLTHYNQNIFPKDGRGTQVVPGG